MSDTEREALAAGTVWWEAGLFAGNPDWQRLLALPAPALSAEEQAAEAKKQGRDKYLSVDERIAIKLKTEHPERRVVLLDPAEAMNAFRISCGSSLMNGTSPGHSSGRSAATITPPISPGPAVAATALRSWNRTPASPMALAIRRSRCDRCARAAISGTMPP